MTIQITHAAPAASERSLQAAMLRGARLTCPACGTGRLYTSYLKVADREEESFFDR